MSLYLHSQFPADPIIGEEDTSELRANDVLREKVVGLVNEHYGAAQTWEEDKCVRIDDSVCADILIGL